MKLIYNCCKCKREEVGSVNSLPKEWQHVKIKGFDTIVCLNCMSDLKEALDYVERNKRG